ncbi:kinase-like protein [Xylaria arbuscula]|nr:kinase-like protein [Xylaria arbuscula]
MYSNRTNKLIKTVQNDFQTSKYWEFEKVLGAGTFGLAVLLKEKDSAVNSTKRMTLKIAQSIGTEQLQNEIYWLKRLHGAKHIVKMLASCDELVDHIGETEKRNAVMQAIDRVLAMSGKIDRIPPITAFDTLDSLWGPALAIEYLENGDLWAFVQQLVQKGTIAPNRVLWSFFLCLVRACIGMANPIGSSLDEPSILETIPTDGRPPFQLSHDDISLRNIMLGSLDGLDEHKASPPIKLIDFGTATENSRDGESPMTTNITAVAQIIGDLIERETMRERVAEWRGKRTHAGILLPDPSGNDPYPLVDPELRDLLARCMYENGKDRPSLVELLNITSRAVLTKTPEMFPDPTRETDAAIRQFWQELIYDAPFPELDAEVRDEDVPME